MMGPWTWTIPEFWCGVIWAEGFNVCLLIVLMVCMHYRNKRKGQNHAKREDGVYVMPPTDTTPVHPEPPAGRGAPPA